MQNFDPNQGLPVPCNQVDNRWHNNNLPQGNDKVPQIQLSSWMQQNSQVGLMAIGLLRSMAQSAAGKSSTHCLVYNMFAQNGFQNQVWQQWCQTVVTFTEMLILVKQYPPQNAVSTAAQRTMEAALGMAFSAYPQLQQTTPNQMWAGLQQAQQLNHQLQNDLRAYTSGAMNNAGNFYNNGGGNGNLGPINQGGYNQPNPYSNNQGNGYSNNQVSGYSNVSTYQVQNQHQQTPAGSAGVHNSLYDLPSNAPAQPLTPKEEISTDYFGRTIPQEQSPMNTFNAPVQEQPSDLPVPSSVDEVVVDPTYYQPTGFRLDINRAYDVIHNPGGVEIRPAQSSDWELTVGDDAPWAQLMDPQSYCLFHVRFPNGVVKEKFVQWTPAMDYLRHELDAELRRKAYRPQGIVVSSSTPISTIGGDPIKSSQAEELVKDGHLKVKTSPPVSLSMIFQGANDLEVEAQVREEMANLMGTNFSTDIPMPNVEYRSTFVNIIDINDEAYEELVKLIETKNLAQVAHGLRDLALRGVISIRTMRVINDRLTKAVNAVMKDGMSLTIEIDDFCEDYLSLEDYLETKRGAPMRKVLQGGAQQVLSRAMNLVRNVEEDDAAPVYTLDDNYINFQLGWDLDDLATLNVKSGKPVLVSELAHPVILETLKGMITRANENKDAFTGILRLITRDGYYLEACKGRLMQNATLLKLVK